MILCRVFIAVDNKVVYCTYPDIEQVTLLLGKSTLAYTIFVYNQLTEAWTRIGYGRSYRLIDDEIEANVPIVEDLDILERVRRGMYDR